MKRTFILIFIGVLLTSNKAGVYANEEIAYNVYNQGIVMYQKGDFGGAKKSFTEAIKIYPYFVDAHFNLGMLYLDEGKLELASAEFNKVLEINQNDEEARRKLYKIKNLLNNDNERNGLQLAAPPKSGQFSDATQYVTPGETKVQNTSAAIGTVYPLKTVFTGVASPTGIALSRDKSIYVANYSENTITKISTNGNRKVIKSSLIDGPIGIVTDGADNLYIASYNNGKIIKLSPNGKENIVSSGLDKPYSLLLNNNMIYVSEQGTDTVSSIRIK